MDVKKSFFVFTALLLLMISLPLYSDARDLPCSAIKMAESIEERDAARLSCLKKVKKSITIPQCLGLAKKMEYATNAEDVREMCLYDLAKSPTINECLQVTRAMEFPDTGDDARWECIRKFTRVLTVKECMLFSKGMKYPANAQRSEYFCKNEL